MARTDCALILAVYGLIAPLCTCAAKISSNGTCASKKVPPPFVNPFAKEDARTLVMNKSGGAMRPIGESEYRHYIIKNRSPFSVNILLKEFLTGVQGEGKDQLEPGEDYMSSSTYFKTLTVSGCLSLNMKDEGKALAGQFGARKAIEALALGGVLKGAGAAMGAGLHGAVAAAGGAIGGAVGGAVAASGAAGAAVTGACSFVLTAGGHTIGALFPLLFAACPACAIIVGLIGALLGLLTWQSAGYAIASYPLSTLLYFASNWVRKWLQKVKMSSNDDIILIRRGRSFKLPDGAGEDVRTVLWKDLVDEKQEKEIRVFPLKNLSVAMKDKNIYSKMEMPSSFLMRQVFEAKSKVLPYSQWKKKMSLLEVHNVSSLLDRSSRPRGNSSRSNPRERSTSKRRGSSSSATSRERSSSSGRHSSTSRQGSNSRGRRPSSTSRQGSRSSSSHRSESRSKSRNQKVELYSSEEEAVAPHPEEYAAATSDKSQEFMRLQKAFEAGVLQYTEEDHVYSPIGEDNIYISEEAFAAFVQDQVTYSFMDATVTKKSSTICGGFGDPEPYFVDGKVIYVVNTYHDLALLSECPKQVYYKVEEDEAI